jgi:hypothetical protein
LTATVDAHIVSTRIIIAAFEITKTTEPCGIFSTGSRVRDLGVFYKGIFDGSRFVSAGVVGRSPIRHVAEVQKASNAAVLEDVDARSFVGFVFTGTGSEKSKRQQGSHVQNPLRSSSIHDLSALTDDSGFPTPRVEHREFPWMGTRSALISQRETQDENPSNSIGS